MKLTLAAVWLALVTMVSPVVAQVAIVPESPRWGETIAIAADPTGIPETTEKVYPVTWPPCGTRLTMVGNISALVGANLIQIENPEFESEYGERLAQIA